MDIVVAKVCSCASRGARMCVCVCVCLCCRRKSGGPEGRFNRSASEDAGEKELKRHGKLLALPGEKHDSHMPDVNTEVSMCRGGV